MTQTKTLRKPTFIKVKDILPGSHGYNVLVRIVSVQTTKVPSFEGERTVAKTVVGDSTALANAVFINPPADLIKEGQVIAIRNGRSNVIKEQIELRIDQFGRLTPEQEKIQTTGVTLNISEKKWVIDRTGQNQRQRGRGGARRNFGNRDNNRPARNNGNEDRYDRRGGYNPPRRDIDYDRDYDRKFDRKDNNRGYNNRRDQDNRRDYDRRDYDRRDYDRRDYDRRDNDRRDNSDRDRRGGYNNNRRDENERRDRNQGQGNRNERQNKRQYRETKESRENNN